MNNQEKILQEKLELDALLDRGVEFKLGKKKYLIKEFYGGTLDYLSAEFIKLANLENEDLNDKELVNKYINNNVKTWANIIAIAILNNKWKIRFLRRYIANKVLWKYKPSDLENLVYIISKMGNYEGFILSSIRIAGMRTTKPKMEEGKQKV